jgi:predicted O-methyltransferase YrrM
MGAQEQWSAGDEYLLELLAYNASAMEAVLSASEAAGLPAIQVSPSQGKLLYLMARSLGAGAILELGTLGAYSTIWLACGLAAGGRLITLEVDPAYAKVARENIARAGRDDAVDLRVGPALDLLPELHDEGAGPFDFTFIDADKENSPAYFAWALEHSRPGSLIVADNVIREGPLADSASYNPKAQALRRLHETILAERRVSAKTVQTRGSKSPDGFTVALVVQ